MLHPKTRQVWISYTKNINSHLILEFVDTTLEKFTPAPHVVHVTNIRSGRALGSKDRDDTDHYKIK